MMISLVNPHPRRRYQRADLIALLRRLAEEVHHIPTAREYKELVHGSGPNQATILRYFGTWLAALDAAGLRREQKACTHCHGTGYEPDPKRLRPGRGKKADSAAT